MPFCANTTPVSAPTIAAACSGESAEQVGFQGDENKILQSQLGRARGRAHPPADGLVAVDERYPVVAHRLQVRAARDDRHVVPARGELRSEMPADRACAENADPHLDSRIVAMSQKLPVVIAGAGPTGLMCALALARRGVPVVVCEGEPSLTHDLRAGTFHPPTQEMMAPYGITAAHARARAAGAPLADPQPPRRPGGGVRPRAARRRHPLPLPPAPRAAPPDADPARHPEARKRAPKCTSAIASPASSTRRARCW